MRASLKQLKLVARFHQAFFPYENDMYLHMDDCLMYYYGTARKTEIVAFAS